MAKNQNPNLIHKNIVVGDQVSEETQCAKFDADQPTGGLQGRYAHF